MKASGSPGTLNSPSAEETGKLKIFHPAEFAAALSFMPKSNSYVQATLAECDLIVFPELLQARKDTEKKLGEISKYYRAHRQQTLVFVLNDYEEKYHFFSNLIVARTSARAKDLRPNEVVLPYIWESPATAFRNSPRTALPRVGFCGLASRPRKAIIKTFATSGAVQCDFIVRDQFWGGAPHNPKLVAEYYANMERNQYILCNRGAGNFSIRFYQTLASGRIPVLVNTDMPLPFDDRIPWRELIVFEKNENDCLARVLEIHQAGEYLNMQNRCLETFARFFSWQNFFDRLAEDLKAKYLTAAEV